MTTHNATVYVDYQQRASEFSVGDLAYPLAGGATDESQAGKVVAVYPAIGQVDIEFPWGSGRFPVEDVQRVTGVAAKPPATEHSTVPGGAGTVRVPGGPEKKAQDKRAAVAVGRVAHAFVKSALYWASKDRHYRATKTECEGGQYQCPKCRRSPELDEIPTLRPARYKRVEGQSYKLLGCPHCLFLIKAEHIIGDPAYDAHTHDSDEGGEDGLLAEAPEVEWSQGFESVRSVRAAAEDQTLQITARGDAPKMFMDMLSYIQKVGDGGHSFEIVVDPDDSEYRKSFGFDGDGADRILSIKMLDKAGD